jgi:hypothetical protein
MEALDSSADSGYEFGDPCRLSCWHFLCEAYDSTSFVSDVSFRDKLSDPFDFPTVHPH